LHASANEECREKKDKAKKRVPRKEDKNRDQPKKWQQWGGMRAGSKSGFCRTEDEGEKKVAYQRNRKGGKKEDGGKKRVMKDLGIQQRSCLNFRTGTNLKISQRGRGNPFRLISPQTMELDPRRKNQGDGGERAKERKAESFITETTRTRLKHRWPSPETKTEPGVQKKNNHRGNAAIVGQGEAMSRENENYSGKVLMEITESHFEGD